MDQNRHRVGGRRNLRIGRRSRQLVRLEFNTNGHQRWEGSYVGDGTVCFFFTPYTHDLKLFSKSNPIHMVIFSRARDG